MTEFLKNWKFAKQLVQSVYQFEELKVQSYKIVDIKSNQRETKCFNFILSEEQVLEIP